MSSGNSRVRFHMGCGECLQSRWWVVRSIGAAAPRSVVKVEAGNATRSRRQRGGGCKS